MALANNCIAHWKLNDTSVGVNKAIDSIGNYNGTHVNMDTSQLPIPKGMGLNSDIQRKS